MSEDVLREATRALREEGSAGSPESSRFTRARVMASLHKRERRRTTKLAFLLPIAAVLVGSTALGAAGGRLPSRWQTLSDALGFSPAPVTQSLARPAGRGAAYARQAPRPVATPTAEPVREVAAPATPAAVRVEKAHSVVVPAVAPPTPTDAAHELYRAAHRRHFTENDAGGALAAWDAYLAAAPRGRFATEARYNRALCLVRLGRSAEARVALEPFAEGRFGGYRQREASQLSEALGATPR